MCTQQKTEEGQEQKTVVVFTDDSWGEGGGAGTHAIVQLVKGSAATSCNVRLRGRGTYQHADSEAKRVWYLPARRL